MFFVKEEKVGIYKINKMKEKIQIRRVVPVSHGVLWRFL